MSNQGREEPEFELRTDAEPPNTVSGRLKANIRDTRSRNLLLVMASVIVVSAIIIVWVFSSDEPIPTGASTAVRAGGQAPSVVGAGDPTEAVRAEAEENDRIRAEQALAEGRSAAARPIGSSDASSRFADLPLNEPLAEVEEIIPEVTPTPEPAVDYMRLAAEETYRAQRRAERAVAMKAEIARLTQVNQSISGPVTNTLEAVTAEAGAQNADAIRAASIQRDAGRELSTEQSVVLTRAGTLEYGLLEDKADTDIRAPVFASLATGPFAGALLRGTFQPDARYNCIILEFDQLTPVSGPSIGIRAMAVDTAEQNRPCVVDERNGRFALRLVSAVALGVLRGAGEDAKTAGTTSVVTPGGAAVSTSESGRRTGGYIAGGIADETTDLVRGINTQPQVIKNPGGIGIRFLDDITGALPSQSNG